MASFATFAGIASGNPYIARDALKRDPWLRKLLTLTDTKLQELYDAKMRREPRPGTPACCWILDEIRRRQSMTAHERIEDAIICGRVARAA